MEDITYSLKAGSQDSEHYYRECAAFADEVMCMTDDLAGEMIANYMLHIGEEPQKECNLKQEHGFELLVLGVLWQVYSGDAAGIEKAPLQLMSALSRLRAQNTVLKPGIDFIRGIMSTLYLSHDLDDNEALSELTPCNLNLMLDWLEATGEFNREVERLRGWQAFIQTLDSKSAAELLAAAITLAAWFEKNSLKALGNYTANVEKYLSDIRPGRYWHEDVIFCGRRRVEYHLNMVGAEVMNRVFRKEFAAASKKVVIIPACMRSFVSPRCKAEPEEGGMQCKGCSSDCNVNRLTRLGKQHGFKVLMIPHESSLSSTKNEKPLLDSDTGVVGVACVLNLVSGGWMMRSMGIPVQCVLLDYCGCKNHWSRDGIPTGINIDRLKKILNL